MSEEDAAEVESRAESMRRAGTVVRISEVLNRIDLVTFVSGLWSLGLEVLWSFFAPSIIDMRAKAIQIALFVAVGCTAPVAFALSAKPATKPAKHQVQPHQAHKMVSFYVHGAGEHGRAAEKHVSGHQVVERRASGRRGVEREVVERRPGHGVAERRVAERAEPVERRRVEAAARMEPVVREEPVESAPADGDDTLGVHHNRKIHLTEETAAPSDTTSSEAVPSGPRRPATTQDFLDAPAPSEASGATVLRQAPVKTVAAVRPERKIVAKMVPAADVAVTVPPPVVMPALYTRSGRLIVPPALKGSHEILLHQNEMANAEGLERVQDDADLERMRAVKMLVALPVSAALTVDERLPVNRRYCRPWTAQFLAAVARAHYARFHTPLQVNSAVRTVEFQERLRYTNGNAAPAEGETASPHLTGQAVDLAKHGLSMTEIAWMRGYLLPLVQQGKVDVEEEFQQACFHVSVYRRYMPEAAPKRVIPARRGSAMALAAAMR
jgi:hypothetical protein